MDGSGYLYEVSFTGGYSRINLGTGAAGDRDGHWRLTSGYTPANDPTPSSLGSGFDTFPREANFLVGTLTFNESLVNLTGTSVIPIDSFDLSEFWKADSNRTNSTAGSLPTVVSDISDYALGKWFYNLPGNISFGALDAEDTVTFTNGVLTAINLSITTTFTVQSFAWNGTFSINGDDISYQINQSSFQANLNGTVNSVGTYTIPEPSTSLFGCMAVVSVLACRRRSTTR